MGILKEICQDLFSIKNQYIGNYKYKVISIFGFKLRKSLGYKVEGSAKIYIVENGVKKECKKRIMGMSIEVKGCDNEVVIYKPYKFRGCILEIRGDNNLVEIKENSALAHCLFIVNNGSKVRLGNNVTSTHSVNFSAVSPKTFITVGDDCMFASGIQILSGDHHRITSKGSNEIINRSLFCEIGDHVWICDYATICKNVKIPSGSIVGTRAVVTKSFNEENVVIAGNPAKIVKRNVEWHRDND